MAVVPAGWPGDLSERYRPRSLLGEGGYGSVVLAEDLRLGRSVAIKLLHGTVEDPVARERFLREGRVSAGLRHPCLVELLDSGLARGGLPYLVMGYVPGGTLRDRIATGGRSTPEQLVAMGTGLAGALAVLHGAGFVHRDVKPENVVLAEDGRAVLVDLGIARSMRPGETLTKTGLVVGTPLYMAPELWEGRDATPASDQFALAAVLSEAGLGVGVYPSPDFAEILRFLATSRPHLGRPGLGAGLDSVLARALSVAPQARWGDLEEFAQALEAAGREPTPLPGPPPPCRGEAPGTVLTRRLEPGEASPLGPHSRRRGRLPAVAAGFGLALAAGLAWTRGPGPEARSGPDLPAVERPEAAAIAEEAERRERFLAMMEGALAGHRRPDGVLYAPEEHFDAVESMVIPGPSRDRNLALLRESADALVAWSEATAAAHRDGTLEHHPAWQDLNGRVLQDFLHLRNDVRSTAQMALAVAYLAKRRDPLQGTRVIQEAQDLLPSMNEQILETLDRLERALGAGRPAVRLISLAVRIELGDAGVPGELDACEADPTWAKVPAWVHLERSGLEIRSLKLLLLSEPGACGRLAHRLDRVATRLERLRAGNPELRRDQQLHLALWLLDTVCQTESGCPDPPPPEARLAIFERLVPHLDLGPDHVPHGQRVLDLSLLRRRFQLGLFRQAPELSARAAVIEARLEDWFQDWGRRVRAVAASTGTTGS